MKKILLAAVMTMAFAAPTFAADVPEAPSSDAVKTGVKCFILPLLPECIEYWKAKADDAKAKMDEAMK
ncbi:MAG: hypothetical protein ABIO40_08590 [Devosia sp.]